SDCFVLNIDGASKGSPGQAGGGGVIRSNRGEFIKASSSRFYICCAFKVEVKAVKIGPKMAGDLSITKLEVQMDNKACIFALTDPRIKEANASIFSINVGN
ncbi:hypothetical protein RDABS01_020738, partial [Bienertia sinuspersici]